MTMPRNAADAQRDPGLHTARRDCQSKMTPPPARPTAPSTNSRTRYGAAMTETPESQALPIPAVASSSGSPQHAAAPNAAAIPVRVRRVTLVGRLSGAPSTSVFPTAWAPLPGGRDPNVCSAYRLKPLGGPGGHEEY